MIKLLFLAAVLLLITACGGADRSQTDAAPAVEFAAEAAPDAAAGVPMEAEQFFGFDTANRATEEWDRADEADFTAWEPPDIPQPAAFMRRVIRNADIAVETLYFEEAVSRLERIIAANGGFVEHSAQWLAGYLWHSEFTIRVPAARFDETNREITELGHALHFTTTSEDVTMLLLDLESRLNIRLEEERRVEAMRDAATELSDILSLERQLSDLRVVVDNYRRRMTEIDRLAAFSTIRLSLREVLEIEEEEPEYIPYYVPLDPPGFGTRIASAFSASANFSISLFELISVVVVSLIPPALLLSVPALAVLLIYKKLRARLWER
jgi:hypothetical protein